MIISHKVPASNTFKSASTYEPYVYIRIIYISWIHLGLSASAGRHKPLYICLVFYFLKPLDLSVIVQQKKNAKHKDSYMPELALNPKYNWRNQTFMIQNLENISSRNVPNANPAITTSTGNRIAPRNESHTGGVFFEHWRVKQELLLVSNGMPNGNGINSTRYILHDKVARQKCRWTSKNVLHEEDFNRQAKTTYIIGLSVTGGTAHCTLRDLMSQQLRMDIQSWVYESDIAVRLTWHHDTRKTRLRLSLRHENEDP